jgi:hypothetical protein
LNPPRKIGTTRQQRIDVLKANLLSLIPIPLINPALLDFGLGASVALFGTDRKASDYEPGFQTSCPDQTLA